MEQMTETMPPSFVELVPLLSRYLDPKSLLRLRLTCREVCDNIEYDLETCYRLVRVLALQGHARRIHRMHETGQLQGLWLASSSVSRLCVDLIRDGRLPMLSSLHRIGCPYSAEECAAAAATGAMGALVEAMGAVRSWSVEWSRLAARGGHTHILEWAVENDLPLDVDCVAAAAQGGWWVTARWLRRVARAPWGPSAELVCSCAARDGRLDVLKWARYGGCAWDAATSHLAASRGHLFLLQWARAHGCRWDTETVLVALVAGHIHVLRWMILQVGMPVLDETIFAEAIACAPSRTWDWLLEVGCPRDASCYRAAAWTGNLDALDWLYAHEFPESGDVEEVGTLVVNREVLEWAVEHGMSGHW